MIHDWMGSWRQENTKTPPALWKQCFNAGNERYEIFRLLSGKSVFWNTVAQDKEERRRLSYPYVQFDCQRDDGEGTGRNAASAML